jgi:hypothetical protein
MTSKTETKVKAADFGYRPTMSMKQVMALGAKLTQEEREALSLILKKNSEAHYQHAAELEAFALAKFGPDAVTT